MQKMIVYLAMLTLFVLFFIMAEQLLAVWTNRGERLRRLDGHPAAGWRTRFDGYLSGFGKPYRYLADTLEALRWQMQPAGFILFAAVLALLGITGGVVLFQSLKGALLLGCVALGTPLISLRMVSIHKQLQARMDFLPAVELFYQCYISSGARQIRTALQRTVEERRMLGPMQSCFEQLYRNLSVRDDDEASLRIFAAALGHIWGDYFVQIMRVALAEGHPVAENLKMLITDMRKAQRANQQERNRLLEIRIANFTPLLFLVLFVGVNVHYNPGNAYIYYITDPKGRDMMLNAIVLIFLSFVMGMVLSRKKM